MPSGTPDDPATFEAPRHALAPGDRVPDFVLPDAEGAFRHFYERAQGRPIALLLLAGKADLPAAARASATAKALASLGADHLVIAAGDPERSLGEASAPARWLADPRRKILDGLRHGAGLPEDAPAWLLLDANQRLVDLRSGDGLDEWAIRRLEAQGAAPEAGRFGAAAPVLILPHVLDPAACIALIRRWETHGHDEGSVNSLVDGEEVRRVYHAMKKRRDHAIADETLLRSLISVIGRRIAPELDKAFGFRQPFRFDRFIVTCYDAERGDYFRRHRDNASPATADRRFALTLNLNDGDYEGGELVFPEYGPHRYSPPAGAAILFSCSLLHEALPVTRGQRFTLLSFLRDGAAKPGSPARG